MSGNIFQLSVLSQDDPGCSLGAELSVVVDTPTGGTLTDNSFPVGSPVPLPTPPGTSAYGPTPTWFLVLQDGIDSASYSLTISGPNGENPTQITVDGRHMRKWVEQNEKEKTNQIYLEAACGIFGFAQKNEPQGQPTYWIYTVTAGVNHPRVHPPLDG